MKFAGTGQGWTRSRHGDVDVDVGYCRGVKPGEIVFDPFSRTLEAELFCIPGGEDTVFVSQGILFASRFIETSTAHS